MPFQVRLRPNAAYLGVLALGAALFAFGVSVGGVTGVVELVLGAAFVLLLGAPILISTVFRTPVLVADAAGLRLPLMGVRLAWSEIADVRPGLSPHHRPLLLIVPTDPRGAVRRMRPWVRSEGRTNLGRYGTPIVVPEQSMDRTVREMHAAIAQLFPTGNPTAGRSAISHRE